jgi:hypothetical protein
MGALYSASGRKRLRGRRPDREIEKDSHLSRSRKTGNDSTSTLTIERDSPYPFIPVYVELIRWERNDRIREARSPTKNVNIR